MFLVLYGCYSKHLKEAQKLKNNPKVHFIVFEEMKKNPKSEIERLNKFLNTNLTNEQIDNVST